MNRKDTILVAVLINAGVLVVLFTSALKNKQTEKYHALETPIVALEPALMEPVAIMKDEIDLAIEQAKKEQIQPSSTTTAVQEIVFETEAKAHVVEPSQVNSAPIVTTTEVSVKKGDFLAKIAKRYNVSVEEIMKVNGLKNSNLRIGQILKIPQTTQTKATLSQAEIKPEPDAAVKYYTIKAGDNPWTIAHKHNMKVDELLKLNGLTAEKAKSLKIGDKLKVKS